MIAARVGTAGTGCRGYGRCAPQRRRAPGERARARESGARARKGGREGGRERKDCERVSDCAMHSQSKAIDARSRPLDGREIAPFGRPNASRRHFDPSKRVSPDRRVRATDAHAYAFAYERARTCVCTENVPSSGKYTGQLASGQTATGHKAEPWECIFVRVRE